MILMMVKNEGKLASGLARALAPYGVNVIHYRHPLKALDNLTETDPRIVLFDWVDFPRHWKILVKYLREEFPKDEKVVLLFGETHPPLEEANKALFLGVNGLLQYDGSSANLADKIREVFLRYGTFEEDPGLTSLTKAGAVMSFVFRHPRRKQLVTGIFLHLEEDSATFKPDFGHETADLNAGDELIDGSLRLFDALIALNARVIRNTGQLHLALQPSRSEDARLLREKLHSFEQEPLS
ncbi:MAG: hypothetical protein HKM05_03040 [Spirochaetales bacterium]|nr:hypothetical protein [Spirochaetales bacterium]